MMRPFVFHPRLARCSRMRARNLALSAMPMRRIPSHPLMPSFVPAHSESLLVPSDTLPDVSAYCVAQVDFVFGSVELLQLFVQGAPPALGAISLETLLDPPPGALEPEVLLELLGCVHFE